MKQGKRNNLLPMILIILDGFGISKNPEGNPFFTAKMPHWKYLLRTYPNCHLVAHGKKVGLPNGQDGNSEAGHMNIGGGRIVKQEAVQINETIDNGTFFKNPALIEAIRHAKKNKSNLHLMGLLSNGQSAHSDPKHLYALLKFIKQQKFERVYLHLFTDGRDSSPHAAARLLNKLIDNFQNNEIISTISGRFYAMDRIKFWKRTAKAYNAMVLAEGIVADNPYKAITQAYNRGETDEFITPTVIMNPVKKSKFIADNDSVIFFNLRSDRARQMAKPFVQTDFEGKNVGEFKRKKVLKNLKFIALTDFGPDLDNIMTAFPSITVENPLPYVLKSLRQLYISEREKYAHVTYFFNGGHNKPVNGEVWKVIPSTGKQNYETCPQMSIIPLTKILLDVLKKNKYDFITVNFPNADMIGHTGNFNAAVKALGYIDRELGRIYKLITKIGGTMIVTADHGNVEEMINHQTGEMDTEHSTNPVPFVLVNKDLKKVKLIKNGILGDVAPTILEVLHIKKPSEMTGKSLLKSKIKK